jgi:hypothetical protein
MDLTRQYYETEADHKKIVKHHQKVLRFTKLVNSLQFLHQGGYFREKEYCSILNAIYLDARKAGIEPVDITEGDQDGE